MTAVSKKPRWNLGNLLHWSVAERCILAASIVLVVATLYALALYFYFVRPDVVYFVNRSRAELAFRLQIYVFVPGWVAIIVAGLILRRLAPHDHILSYIVALFYGIHGSIWSYYLGHYTNLFTGVTLIGGTAIGLVLFDRRPVMLGVAAFLAIVIGTTLAEQLGVLPYAPVFVNSPFREGRLATSWLVTMGALMLALTLVVVALIDHIVRQWRDHELKLTRTGEQLARANELVSRYVAAQVAEQIFAGNYGAVDRHDRRKLTLFFSDIKGFSTMADRMEPEDTSQLLNEYLSEMTAIAQHYGATIDKFIGDALMVFFGAPVATEDHDHAVRAVRMALEMQDRVGELSAKWLDAGLLEEPFQIRVGINSGMASVGNFGSKERMDYTAIGRQVNLAARLQVYCEPGKILLSHSTWVLIKDHVACIEKGEIRVKGMERPVKVYEVSARTARAETPEQEVPKAGR
jgi:class 3 adenylate cyclase